MSMSVFAGPMRARTYAPRMFCPLTLLLAIGAGGALGCVRTTSLGRAAGRMDAAVDQHDGNAEGGTADATAERGSVDRADASSDRGPIVGGGRDAASDGGDDAADDGSSPD